MRRTLLFVLASASAVMAQEAVAVADNGGLSLHDIITRGGGIMYVLVAMSVLALGLIVFFLLTIRKNLLCPNALIEACMDAAARKDLESIKSICQEMPCPASAIIAAAAERLDMDKSASRADLREAMEDEGARQVGTLWQRLQYLMDIAVIAPMFGLLGTVWGMMVSFSGLETGLNIINKADALANGVSQAMFTTFGGLIVGIMAMAFYAVMRGYLNRTVNQMEVDCNYVLKELTK